MNKPAVKTADWIAYSEKVPSGKNGKLFSAGKNDELSINPAGQRFRREG